MRASRLTWALALIWGLAVLLIPGLSFGGTALPARIQAESYTSQSGTYTTATADVDGVNDLYCLWIGDWASYNVDVPVTDDYTITVRVRSQDSTGQFFRIEMDNQDVTGNIGPSTYGSYVDVVKTDVSLTSGSHVMKYYQVAGWDYRSRLNWIEVTHDNTAPSVNAGTDDAIALPADATLDATVTDDGWPGYPGELTYLWTKTSGPGTVTFADEDAVDTTADFSAAGTYVLRLTADDGELEGYDEVQITVSPANTAPTVNAGTDQCIAPVSATATLDATVSDDGLPNPPAAYTVLWTKTSGPGTVTFADDDAVDTTATFSAAGTYVLRLTVDDDDLTAYDEVTIGVSARTTLPAKIEAENYRWGGEALGYHDTTSGNSGGLYRTEDVDIVTCSDTGGGYCTGYAATGEWQAYDVNVPLTNDYDITLRVKSVSDSRQMHVEIDGENVTGTMAFNATGGVFVDVTAEDVSLTAGNHVMKVCYDTWTIDLNYIEIESANAAPTVDAGSDDEIALPADATLDATVSDDGKPNPPGAYTVLWTQESGPGTVTFDDEDSVDTTASFSEAGTYVLRLTADDGILEAYDEVEITVNPANTAPVVNAGDDDAILLSGSATLDGTVTDDGLPTPPGAFTVLWTKQSGPGTVTFADDDAVDTTATFSASGTYVLRLTVDDDDLTSYDEVTVVVLPNSTVILPAKIEAEDYRAGGEGVGYHDTSSGNYGGQYRTDNVDISTCTDTGGGYEVRYIVDDEWLAFDVYVPYTSKFTFTFRVDTKGDNEPLHVELDGENVTGTVTCNSNGYGDVVKEDVELTTGSHVLKVVFDTTFTYTHCLNYIDIAGSTPPTVNAGSDQAITLPTNSVSLNATVTDDGLPDPPGAYTVRWTVASGPENGYVEFADVYAEDTTATFAYPGVYVLRLTADDSLATGYDDVQVTVNEATDRVSLPGRLEAEDYSDQGEGVSYYDTTSGNAGNVYRTDDVDIESCGDTGGGYDVYTIAADEWLAFAVEVDETGCYDIVARVSSTSSGREMHVEVDGEDVTGAMTFGSTGGWTNVTAEGIHLTAGSHVMTIAMDTGDFKLNYVDVLNETYEEYIVEDNTANADIVISSDPTRSAALAAEELQAVIEDITGATLPIVTTQTGAEVHIYVGQSSYTDSLGLSVSSLEHGAYKIASGNNWLALLGHDDDYTPIYPYGTGAEVLDDWDTLTEHTWAMPYAAVACGYDSELDIWNSDGKGSLNAVYAFLYDLGCRWYFPGTIGQTLPDLDDIGLTGANRTVEPDFALRELYQYYNRFYEPSNADEVRWQLRLGLNDGRDTVGLGPHGHGIAFVIARDEYATSHPEYYALWGGVRQSGAGTASKPCLSSAGLLAENVAYVETLFDHYEEPMVNVSPSDGYYKICECELCEGKDTPDRGNDGKLSDYVWAYVNELAEEVYVTYPTRKVNSLAYTTYYLPPEEIEEMSPNVVITFCRWRSSFDDAATRQKYEDAMAAWMEKLPSEQFCIWDYYLHARPPENDFSGIPVYFPWLIQNDLRFLKGKSIGDFIEVQRNWPDWNLPYHALATNHLNVYLTARLYWDADQDVEALLDEYYTKFYGDAADEMEDFVEYCEDNWLQASEDRAADDYTRIENMRTLLNLAITAAGTGVDADRVDLVNDFLAVGEEQ